LEISYTDVKRKKPEIVEINFRILFTPLSKVRLLVSRFSWNSNLRDKYWLSSST